MNEAMNYVIFMIGTVLIAGAAYAVGHARGHQRGYTRGYDSGSSERSGLMMKLSELGGLAKNLQRQLDTSAASLRTAGTDAEDALHTARTERVRAFADGVGEQERLAAREAVLRDLDEQQTAWVGTAEKHQRHALEQLEGQPEVEVELPESLRTDSSDGPHATSDPDAHDEAVEEAIEDAPEEVKQYFMSAGIPGEPEYAMSDEDEDALVDRGQPGVQPDQTERAEGPAKPGDEEGPSGHEHPTVPSFP